MDQYFFEPEAHFESNRDVFVKEKWRSMSATSTVPENGSGCFECNICLDSANEPVVTLCGHLYCWPCIYKWLQVQSNMNEPDQQKCPVCKANISHASLVPLYGRGTSHWDSETKKPQLDLVIPRRPLPSGLNAIITSTTTSTSQQNHHLYPNNFQSNLQSRHQQYFPYPYGAHVAGGLPSSRLGAAVMTSLITPTIAIFGEMVFARMFGNLGTSLFPYPPTGSSGPRMRRHEMRFDRSLNRVSIFFSVALYCVFSCFDSTTLFVSCTCVVLKPMMCTYRRIIQVRDFCRKSPVRYHLVCKYCCMFNDDCSRLLRSSKPNVVDSDFMYVLSSRSAVEKV